MQTPTAETIFQQENHYSPKRDTKYSLFTVNFYKDPNTQQIFLNALEQAPELSHGRYSVSREDLAILLADFQRQMINGSCESTIIGEGGNLHIIMHYGLCALKFNKENWVLRIDKYDVFSLCQNIHRVLMESTPPADREQISNISAIDYEPSEIHPQLPL